MACLLHHLIDSEPIPFAEPGVRPHYAPDRVVRIVHASILLRVDPERRTFSGEARLQLRALPTFAGSFSVDLDEVAVESVTDGRGEPLPYEHGDGRVTVRAPSVPEEIRIRWSGADPRHGLYFTGPIASEPGRSFTAWTQCQDEDGHFVFPCHDHPSVKHPWTLELEAPIGYTLLSNGERTDGGERDGRAWARFEQRDPMPAYLVTFVAAPLVAVGDAWRDREVRYLVPPGREGEVERAFGRTPAMIEHFSRITGVPFPWPRYDQVVVHEFVFGGMENVSCTTMTDLILVDAKAALEWDPDALVAHELAHQWFGDLVTCQDWSQGWLNESWATFMEAVWAEHHHPGTHEEPSPASVWSRWLTAAGYHAEASGRYRRSIVHYEFREPIDLFDRHLYNKGSCVLWTLRHELGPTAFWAGVQRYLEQHRHQTVHTRHFQRALEEATGTNLERFFSQWVYAPGHPSLEVTLGRNGDHQVTVGVRQTQEGEGVPQAFAFVLRLGIVPVSGEERTVELRITERERTFVIPVAGAVSHLRVDPGYRLLAEIRLKGPDHWLEKLAADRCPVLAVRAVKALLLDGGARGLAAAERTLGGHPFHGVRGAVAAELGRVGTTRAFEVLAAALRSESDPRTRRAIATAIGTFRRPEAADALIALLSEELPTWQLEGAALGALGHTRDPRAGEVIAARLDRPSWVDCLRQRALEALAETEDPAVFELLMAHTRAPHPDRTRGAAATAIGRLLDAVEELRRPGVERLIELSIEPGFRAQLHAIAALGRIRDPRAEAALSRIHQTAPDGRTRRSAYEALVQVRRGRTTEQGLIALRRRLDGLAEENLRLRERIDRLER